MRFAFLFFVLLLSDMLSADDEFRVRIVDENGVPAPAVLISSFWGFNGPLPTPDNDGSESNADWLKRYRREIGSQMGSPFAEAKCSVTERDGCASVAWSGRAAAIAYNQDKTAGTLLQPTNESSGDVVLGKLTRVTVSLDSVADAASPEWWYVRLNVPYDAERPTIMRQIGICETFSPSLTMLLPVGEYEVTGLGSSIYESGIVDLKSPNALRVTITKDTHASIDFKLKLNDDTKSHQRLELESKAKGRWTEHESLVGKPAPRWHASDARGIAMDSKPSDFRGKWLLIYFWSPDCIPCVGKEIPKLMEFWDQQSDRRHQLAIVAVCYDFREKLTTMDKLDARLKDIQAKVWKGRELPFPQVLDATFKSIERYGISSVGNSVLVNPRGLVVEGGLARLVEELDQTANIGVTPSGESDSN